jgi:GntR family transcriptional regulator
LESREPLYYQIKRVLLGRMERGEWEVGAQLPTEQELQEEFGVSRGTVRKALDELVFEGRIYRRSGKGTFVTELPPRVQTQQILSFTEQVRRRNLVPSTQVLSAEEIAASEAGDWVRQAFELGMADPVIRIQRLRLGNDQPLSLQTVYLLPSLCPGILEHDLVQLMPLYEKYGKRIYYGNETIRVTWPSEEAAKQLQIEPGDAAVVRFRVSYLEDDQPFEVLHSLDRAETFEYRHRVMAGKG